MSRQHRELRKAELSMHLAWQLSTTVSQAHFMLTAVI